MFVYVSICVNHLPPRNGQLDPFSTHLVHPILNRSFGSGVAIIYGIVRLISHTWSGPNYLGRGSLESAIVVLEASALQSDAKGLIS